jgi:hypothetical protein
MTLPGIYCFRTSDRSNSSCESYSESFRTDSLNLPDHHFPSTVNTWAQRALLVKREAAVRARWRAHA